MGTYTITLAMLSTATTAKKLSDMLLQTCMVRVAASEKESCLNRQIDELRVELAQAAESLQEVLDRKLIILQHHLKKERRLCLEISSSSRY